MASGSQRPKVVVGLDFGTTFSGCAFAPGHIIPRPGNESELFPQLQCHHNWPSFHAGPAGEAYCKTVTALLYTKTEEHPFRWSLKPKQCWGWEAYLKWLKLQKPSSSAGNGHEHEFITRFKLHLASQDSGASSAKPLPAHLSRERVITDFLREIGTFFLEKVVKKFLRDVDMKDVQWCLTVPAIWDDRAKQLMKKYAEAAGLSQPAHGPDNGGSRFPILIVLEPEAASLYCQTVGNLKRKLKKGDNFMTVDAGGGTVDVVMHCKNTDEPFGTCRQVARSDGGLCGGTYVDDAFIEIFRRKVPCFSAFEREHPEEMIDILQWVEKQKLHFGAEDDSDEDEPYVCPLPMQLRTMWEELGWDKSRFKKKEPHAIVFTSGDMKSAFDPTIDKIIRLIEAQLSLQPDCKVIFMVGGFSMSDYLLNRVKGKFRGRAGMEIVLPMQPGAAVCKGAVLYGLNPDIFSSRILRRTYGIAISDFFREGVDPADKRFVDEKGKVRCRDRFLIFAQIGEEVAVDKTIDKTIHPISVSDVYTSIPLYSSSSKSPQYVTEAGAVLEGRFSFEMPKSSCGRERTINVTMSFGKTSIEVEARLKDFSCEARMDSLPVEFQ